MWSVEVLEEPSIALSETNGRLRFEVGVFDLDGTVLSRDLSISEATLRALAALRERGLRLVVATGRSYESAREQAGRLGFGGDDPLVCYGGSMVRRMSGETLLSHPVAPDATLDVLEWAAGRGLHARVFVIDGRVVVPEGEPPDAAVLPTRPPKGEPPPHLVVVGDVAGWLRSSGEEVMKVVIVDEPDGVEGWLGEAQETFAGRLHVTRSLPHYVEVGSPEGNKAEALRFLCGSWGVEPGRVLAFGDADNDVEMLRFAGLGVAVGGGMSPAVRHAADATAPPVEEDGVARFVDGLLREGGL